MSLNRLCFPRSLSTRKISSAVLRFQQVTCLEIQRCCDIIHFHKTVKTCSHSFAKHWYAGMQRCTEYRSYTWIVQVYLFAQTCANWLSRPLKPVIETRYKGLLSWRPLKLQKSVSFEKATYKKEFIRFLSVTETDGWKPTLFCLSYAAEFMLLKYWYDCQWIPQV